MSDHVSRPHAPDSAGVDPRELARYFGSTRRLASILVGAESLGGSGTGPTGGFGSISFRLPRAPVFQGTRLYAQWLVVDPHAGGNCSATPAVEILIF